MSTPSTQQLLPLPSETDAPDVPVVLTTLVTALEKRLVGAYASAAARDGITSPGFVAGQVCYLLDTKKFYIYDSGWKLLSLWQDGGAWLAGHLPQFYKGTTAPSNSTGADGDIFFVI